MGRGEGSFAFHCGQDKLVAEQEKPYGGYEIPGRSLLGVGI